MRKARSVLKGMRVGEISLVPEGDNPGADVLILKMRDATHVPSDVAKQHFDDFANGVAELFELAAGGEGAEGAEQASTILKGLDMTLEELQEKLDTIEASLDTVTKERDAAVSRADAAETKVTELTGQVEAVTKERDDLKAGGTETEEDVLKGLPESIRKRLETAEATAKTAAEAVEKERDDRELAEAVSKARELGVTDAEGVGGLLHRVRKGKATAEDATKIEEILKQAKTVGDKGNALFEAIGKATGGDANASEAQAKLDAAIADIRKAKPALTQEQAYAEALDANPGLYDEVRKIKPVGIDA